MKSEMKCVHLIVCGDVQGVGFRSFVRSHARKRGLVGWVKNREDGGVEIEAHGSQEHITELIEHCKKGPDVSFVQDVQVTWGVSTHEYDSFNVVY